MNHYASPTPSVSSTNSPASKSSRAQRRSGSQDGNEGQVESSSQADSRRSIPPSPLAAVSMTASPASDYVPKRNGKASYRSSGGFLLGSAFKLRKQVYRDGNDTGHKGKGRLSDLSRIERDEQTPGSSPNHSQRSSSPRSRQSDHLSAGHGPSQEISGFEGDADQEVYTPPNNQRHYRRMDENEPMNTVPHKAPSALDPTQLVQMALSLSEGRRRYASGGFTPPASTIDGRRVRSAGAPVVPGSPSTPLVPLAPLAFSPDHSSMTQSTPPNGMMPSIPNLNLTADVNDHDGIIFNGAEQPLELNFSVGTLNRAEKVRKYFEISSHYWRLLDCLPPLKPDSTAAGNYTFATRNSPGSSHSHMTRVRSNTVTKHDLGRAHNPLQYLRNKRTRHRERRPLEPPPLAFEDVVKVKDYVDDIVEKSSHPEYRANTDAVMLPPFDIAEETRISSASHASIGHRRSDTAASKVLWVESSWSFTPMDLLADTVWSEHPDNKALVENRRGQRLFPQAARTSMENIPSARVSNDLERVESTNLDTVDSSVGREDDVARGRGRKKRKFLSIHRLDSETRKRLSWNRNRSSDSAADSSGTDTQRRKLKPKPRDENTGPLERHMRRMLEHEEVGGSPEIVSPEKWSRISPSGKVKRPGRISLPGEYSGPDGHLSPVKPPPMDLRKARSFDDGLSLTQTNEYTGQSSFEDPDSTAPSSPAVQTFVPPFGMSLSPPPSRKQSPVRSLLNAKLFPAKADSIDRHPIERTDFATNGVDVNKSQRDTKESVSGIRRSFESARPVFLQRHRTTHSLSGSIKFSDGTIRPIAKDGNNAVSRLLKGGRLGDLVRGEGGRLGDRFRTKEHPEIVGTPTDAASDVDEISMDDHRQSEDGSLRKWPTDASHAARTASKDRAEKPRYHIPLPSFRSSTTGEKETGSDHIDPISRQQSVRREKPERSGVPTRPTLPPLILPRPDRQSSPERQGRLSRTKDETEGEGRQGSYGFLSPIKLSRKRSRNGEVSPTRPWLRKVRTSFDPSSVDSSKSKSEEPPGVSALGKRHWSIYDKKPEKTSQNITNEEVARVRALFLSSGIKASELCRRVDAVPETPSAFLSLAAKSAGKQLSPVIRRKEISTAARLLSGCIKNSLQGCEHEIKIFRTETAPSLKDRADSLKQKAAGELTLQVHQTADEADAFSGGLNTQQTMAVKQVNDAVDNMFRNRRRRFRWIKRIGFTLLEWLVLGLMWGVWFTVVVLRTVHTLVRGVVKSVRWVVWC